VTKTIDQMSAESKSSGDLNSALPPVEDQVGRREADWHEVRAYAARVAAQLEAGAELGAEDSLEFFMAMRDGRFGPEDAARARATLMAVLERDAAVTDHTARGPGALGRACRALLPSTDEVELARLEEQSELAEVKRNALLSDAGKAKASAEIVERYASRRAGLLAPRRELAARSLVERRGALAELLAAVEAPKPTDADRIVRRLELLALLTCASSQDERSDLVRTLVREASPLAADALRTLALSGRDPLKVKSILAAVEADLRPAARQALVAEPGRLHAAAELYLVRAMQHRAAEAARLLEKGESGLAKALLLRDLP